MGLGSLGGVLIVAMLTVAVTDYQHAAGWIKSMAVSYILIWLGVQILPSLLPAVAGVVG